MKIMIAGSKPSDCSADIFAHMCDTLSNSLARSDHEIVIGSERADTADYLVFNKLLQHDKRTNVKIFYHDNKDAPFKNLVNTGKMRIEYARVEGNWETGRISQLLYSDIIVVVGGSTKTEQLAIIAKQINKPVLPIPAAGGASRSLWEKMRSEISRASKKQRNLWDKVETWGSNSGEAVMSLIYEQYKQSKSNSLLELSALFGLVVLAISTWVLCFDFNIFDSAIAKVVLSIGCSSFLGSALFYLSKHVTGEIDNIGGIDLALRSFSGFIVGFSLFIIYIVSGSVILGELSFLDKLAHQDDYKRVVAWLSSLGLVSGLLLERSLDGLKKKLITELSDK